MADLIDRQAAITQLSHNKNKGDDEWELAVDNDIQTIWKLPPAQPEPCEDAVSRTAVQYLLAHFVDEDKYVDACDGLKHLPPVTPKQRTGHWHITDAYPHNVYCSECHKRFAQTHWAVWEDGSLPRNFRPNCGAKMEGAAE